MFLEDIINDELFKLIIELYQNINNNLDAFLEIKKVENI